jgi:uncharacterized protein (TIGR02284 family)
MTKTTPFDTELEKLITCCEDGYKGYVEAADAVKSPELREEFQECAKQRMSFRNELLGFNPSLDGDNEGSFAGKTHRAWINLKDKLNVSDEEICADCITGEKQAIDQYEEVLEQDELDPSLRAVVQRQHDTIVMKEHWLESKVD